MRRQDESRKAARTHGRVRRDAHKAEPAQRQGTFADFVPGAWCRFALRRLGKKGWVDWRRTHIGSSARVFLRRMEPSPTSARQSTSLECYCSRTRAEKHGQRLMGLPHPPYEKIARVWPGSPFWLLYSGFPLSYGSSCSVICALSPTTTMVIDPVLRYCAVIFRTSSGVTPFTLPTYVFR